MQSYEKTGALIAKARHEKNMTQKQLASLLHISDTTVSKWERGKGFPDVSLILPLSEALSLTAAELFAGERQPQPDTDALIADVLAESEAQKRQLRMRHAAALLVFLAVVLLIAVPLLFFRAETPPSLVGTYQYLPAAESAAPHIFLSLAVDWPDDSGRGAYSLFADSRLVEEGTYITNADGTFTLFGSYSDGTPRMFLLEPDKKGSFRLLLSGCPDFPFPLEKLADIPVYSGTAYGDEEEYRIKLLPPLS